MPAASMFYAAGKPQLSYKDSEGTWHNDGSSYSENDVVNLIIAASRAKSKIRELGKSTKNNQPPTDTDE